MGILSRSGALGARGAPEILIVGGGFGGIGLAAKLKQAGINSFTVCEKSPRVGGTWWDNQYPGAEVDVASHMYSFGFVPYDWSRTHARQAELHGYLEHVVDKYDLWSHFRLETTVEDASWDDQLHSYHVRLKGGEELRAHVLVSAVGMLSNPRYPEWPGLEDFKGIKFHTARWEHGVDLTDKRVAIVGTGSTATQIVPELAPLVSELYLFQREPGWILPKGERDFTAAERARLRRPWNHRITRWRQVVRLEQNQIGGATHRPGTKLNAKYEGACRAFIDGTFKDRPDLREAVTPKYPFPGKRPIFNTTFYSALLEDNVRLSRAVTKVTKKGLVDTDGNEYPVDVIVMATGFQPANYLSTLEVKGRGGRSIHEAWKGEPMAFLGLTVPGFPNFYMLYGPNTNGGEIISCEMRQAEHVVHMVKRMIKTGTTVYEVRKDWFERYNRWIDSKMVGTAWVMANNYYKSPSGRIVTQWPYGPSFYGLLTKTLGPLSEKARAH